MKWIAFNIISLAFIILAGWIIYLNREGWGWCIFGAIISQRTIEYKNNKQ